MGGVEDDIKIGETLPRGRVCVLGGDNEMRLYSGPIFAPAGTRLFIAARDIKKGGGALR